MHFGMFEINLLQVCEFGTIANGGLLGKRVDIRKKNVISKESTSTHDLPIGRLSTPSHFRLSSGAKFKTGS